MITPETSSRIALHCCSGRGLRRSPIPSLVFLPPVIWWPSLMPFLAVLATCQCLEPQIGPSQFGIFDATMMSDIYS
jgi:hypothetical protein